MSTEKTTANNVWDTKTQTFHGGQEHRFINNFVEDFSVTTNYLGTPRKALEAAREAVSFFFKKIYIFIKSQVIDTFFVKKKNR